MANPCAPALAAFFASPRAGGAKALVELPIGIAFSGGADSTALLLAAHARWPGQLHALHIHHGLQSAADGFAQHCTALCQSLGLPLHIACVDGRNAPGQSPEDAARRARYAALAQLAQEQGLAQVLLAQHADDQAETLLLALSRGAGLPGLAGMAARFVRHGTHFARPLLGVSALDIRGWLQAQAVAWVEDPSNAQLGYTRNRIRHQLLPALAQVMPQYRATFARSARHAAQAQDLLEDLAAEDLAQTRSPPQIQALQQLSPARQANVLRYWLQSVHGVAPSTAQLAELQHQLSACTTRGHAIAIKLGGGQIRRLGSQLDWYNP